MKESETQKEDQIPPSTRLQTATGILLLALIVFVGIDAYFNNWGIIRTLASLNILQLKDKSGKTWDLLARKDFRILRIKDVQRVVNPDSLLSVDQSYRDAKVYRLYFRNSDSSSVRLQKLYQAVLSLDSSQTIKHTVEDAGRAYRNVQRIIHPGRSSMADSVSILHRDSTKAVSKSDLALGSGDETSAVIRKIVSNPQVFIGAGIGIVALAGVDLLRGDAYVAFSKEDVFHFDSIALGTHAGFWEGSPIDILWTFAPSDSSRKEKTSSSRR
jgi:hypothetical protein